MKKTLQITLFIACIITAAGLYGFKADRSAKTSVYAKSYNRSINTTILTDTVSCLYHQVMKLNQPALCWKKGYIVLENGSIKVGSETYPVNVAPTVTGIIKNSFLQSDKKTVVTNPVIQIVIL